MYDLPGEADVAIMGCPSGVDFEVSHDMSGQGVVIQANDDRAWRAGWPEWRAAVFGFADEVSAFYAASSPKQPYDGEDTKGFHKFEAEWKRRRGRPLGHAA